MFDFDRWDRFLYVPVGASAELVELRRVTVAELFTARGLMNADFAKKMIGFTPGLREGSTSAAEHRGGEPGVLSRRKGPVIAGRGQRAVVV